MINKLLNGILILSAIYFLSIWLNEYLNEPDKKIVKSQISDEIKRNQDTLNQDQHEGLERHEKKKNELRQSKINLDDFSEAELKAIRLIQARYASGDYKTCLNLIDQYLDEPSYSAKFYSWLQEQWDTVATSVAWVLLRTGSCEQAIDLFLKASESEKTLPMSSGLVYCYHHLHLWQDARSECYWYLENKPKDSSMLSICADVHESHFEFNRALELLENAVEFSKNDESKKILTRKLESMRKKSKESSLQISKYSKHFSLLYHGELSEDLAQWVLDTLERSHEELIESYQTRELKAVVDVIIYPKETFANIMSHGPHWMAGVFDGRIKIPVLIENGVFKDKYRETLETTLRHELVHAVFSEMVGRRKLPSWFDEGMAQRFTCESESCNVFSGMPNSGDFLNKNDFDMSFTQYGQAKAQRVYKQSLYLVMALEKIYGRSGLQSIISRFDKQLPLSSDSLLKPLQINFKELIEKSSDLWERRINLIE